MIVCRHSKFLAPFVCFAELALTSLWANFYPNHPEKKIKCTRAKDLLRSYIYTGGNIFSRKMIRQFFYEFGNERNDFFN